MTPVSTLRKTLSVDLEAFAKEILKPHFHSGGPPKKVCPLSPSWLLTIPATCSTLHFAWVIARLLLGINDLTLAVRYSTDDSRQ